MRLRADTRARVPFALVGVLLLVSSAVYAGVVTTRPVVEDRSSAERAHAVVTTASHAAVEQAVFEASRTAASHPLTTPTDTPYGAVLDGPDPFERYLRLLVYVESQRALGNVTATVGGVTASATLPPIDSPPAARLAIDRTHVTAIDGGRLRVEIEGVPYSMRRDHSVVGTTTDPIVVTVATPILELHDRTNSYESRLNTGPVEGGGLGRRLTGRLFATAQARGLAQHGGAPISNVLATRHLELQTNGAALAVQRETFGTADPRGERALVWATGRVGLRDVLATRSATDEWSERVLEHRDAATPGAVDAALTGPRSDADGDRPAAVDPRTAPERALVAVLGTHPGDASTVGTDLGRAIRDAYTVEATLVTESERVSLTVSTEGDRPPGGVLDHVHESTSTEVVSATSPATIDAPHGFEVVEHTRRRVVETTSRERIWRTTEGTTRTVETTTTVTRVDVAVATRYDPVPAPRRPVVDSATRDRLDEAAVDRLLGDSQTRDRVARRAVEGTLDTTPRPVSIDPPQTAYDAARMAVIETHEGVRSRMDAAKQDPSASVGSSPGILADSTAAMDGSPAESAVERIDANRARLVDAPERYAGPEDVVRVRARQLYLDALEAELTADDDHVTDTFGRVEDLLTGLDRSVPRVDAGGVPDRADDGLVVDTTPAYLPVTSVTPRMADVPESYHPLATRNVNLFTVPSEDVADVVGETLVPDREGTVDVAVAAQTLAATRNESVPVNESVAADRVDLRRAVREATDHLAHSQVETLSQRTDLTEDESSRLVDAVLAHHPTVAGRALALTDGSVPERLAADAARRTDANETELAAHLRLAVGEARTDDGGRVPGGPASAVRSGVRDQARTAVGNLAANATERAVERAKHRLVGPMAAMPAGLPVAPVPGSWYVTVNVWVVDVRGAYHRVDVTSQNASPSIGSDGLTYTREQGPVTFDVDGDGTREELGTVEPVAFEVGTVIVVAVPPGPRGVGDTGGDADERSPGWPGPAAAQSQPEGAPRNESQTTPPTIGSP